MVSKAKVGDADGSNPDALAKYQACHQCRKRKTKCDAKRPTCGACSRSWRYAWLRSKDRANYPPLTDCDYDLDLDPSASTSSGPVPTVTLGFGTIPLSVLNATGEEDSAFDAEHMDLIEGTIATLEARIKQQDLDIGRVRSIIDSRDSGASGSSWIPTIASTSRIPAVSVNVTQHQANLQPILPRPQETYQSTSNLSPQTHARHASLPTHSTSTSISSSPSFTRPPSASHHTSTTSPSPPAIGVSSPHTGRVQLPSRNSRNPTPAPAVSRFSFSYPSPPKKPLSPSNLDASFGLPGETEEEVDTQRAKDLRIVQLLKETYRIDPCFEGDLQSRTGAKGRILEPYVDPLQEVFFGGWPAKFPHPELLHHLVEVFFRHFPYASRVVHRPTFEAHIALPPTSPDFPKTTLVHAICAVAGFYTVHIHQPEPKAYDWGGAASYKHEFPTNEKLSFAEAQSLYARGAMRQALAEPDGSFAALQAAVILTWFEYADARWIRTWSYSGLGIQLATKLNLQIDNPWRPPPLSHQNLEVHEIVNRLPYSTINDELARNCFWLAYALDRLQTNGSGWNMLCDEKWISQVLPVREVEFQRGLVVPHKQRQRIDSSDLFTYHPIQHTDSFVLYVKSMILVGLVKSFNTRYNSGNRGTSFVRNFELGMGMDTIDGNDHAFGPWQSPNEPHATSISTGNDGQNGSMWNDPAFRSMHRLIGTYIDSFPKPFRDPVQNGAVDITCYLALLTPFVAMIILHGPHYSPDDLSTQSAREVLTAARRILSYLSLLSNSSFDISLLDPWCSMAFLTASEELMTIAVAQAELGEIAAAYFMRVELEIPLDAFKRMGKRIPLSYRHYRMLSDAVVSKLDVLLTDLGAFAPIDFSLGLPVY